MERLTLHQFLNLTLLLITIPQFDSKPTFTVAEHQPVEYGPANGTRRELAPFQVCLECRCCTADDINNCSMMPCCYGINCNLPNKPYGVCAFVPSVCNCTSCV